eukprot:199071-Prymnesium_polylepis.1
MSNATCSSVSRSSALRLRKSCRRTSALTRALFNAQRGGDDRHAPRRSPWLHYYLLRTPLLKFALRLLSDVALAWLVTFTQYDEAPPFSRLLIYFVWPTGGLLSEYAQLIAADGSLRNELLSWVRADTPSSYRADLFNTVDMVALHLLLLSTVAWYRFPSAHLPLRAFAVLALYVRLL